MKKILRAKIKTLSYNPLLTRPHMTEENTTPMTRKQAKSLGLSKFIPLKTKFCANGHNSFYYVSTFTCCECVSSRRRAKVSHRYRAVAQLRNSDGTVTFLGPFPSADRAFAALEKAKSKLTK